MDHGDAPACRIVLMDGTFASLEAGAGSSIGAIHALVSGGRGAVPQVAGVHYQPGQQWQGWRTLPALVAGHWLDPAIRAAYGWLARHWRPGEALFLFGYSRGGIAVCALAEMIAQVGLLRSDHAGPAHVEAAWQLYVSDRGGRLAPGLCHAHVPVRMIGLFDMVMSPGLRLPLGRGAPRPGPRHARGRIPGNVEHAAHALALDETRLAFAPVRCQPGPAASGAADARTVQMWFRGCHPDIGGQLGAAEGARGLSNIPLVWMLSRAEALGLALPAGWRAHHPCDPDARPVGSWGGWGKIFLSRRARGAGLIADEALHPSVPADYRGPAWLTGALAGALSGTRAGVGAGGPAGGWGLRRGRGGRRADLPLPSDATGAAPA